MFKINNITTVFFVVCILITTFSCQKEGCTNEESTNYDADAKKDDGTCVLPKDDDLNVPTVYAFERNGATSVSYSGQTDRLNQLGEITALLKTADGGAQINAQDLLDMFANTGDNGNGNFSFSSTKQLKSKTFTIDVVWFEELMQAVAVASDSGSKSVMGVEGKAGLVTRSSGSTILVDSNGREFTQLIEKGLMGATFLNQIFNVYLTDDKIGSAVENTILEDGKNYTAMEHHFDEAFGYMGMPEDFSSNYTGSNIVRYWGKYSSTVDPYTGSSDIIMKAFKTGRAAIVAKKYTELDRQRAIIYAELEKVAAATAIHYINETLSETNNGDRLHVLSEAYAFIKALRYAHPDYRKFSTDKIDAFLEDDLGANFWQVGETGLKKIKSELSAAYSLEAVKDDL